MSRVVATIAIHRTREGKKDDHVESASQEA